MIILEEVHLGETAKQDFDIYNMKYIKYEIYLVIPVTTHLGETAKLIVVEVQQCQSEEH